MHKPTYIPTLAKKLRINWSQSFRHINKLYKDPRPILPAAMPEDIMEALGYRRLKRKLPKLKSNVCRTMDKIILFFLKEWNRHSQTINFSINTNFAALAKACHNLDRKTAYLHVGTLIEHGFLRGKQRMKHGVQLLLNPQLLRFDQETSGLTVGLPAAAPAVTTRAGGVVEAPALPLPADLPAAMLQLAKSLASNFSTGDRRRPSKV